LLNLENKKMNKKKNDDNGDRQHNHNKDS